MDNFWRTLPEHLMEGAIHNYNAKKESVGAQMNAILDTLFMNVYEDAILEPNKPIPDLFRDNMPGIDYTEWNSYFFSENLRRKSIAFLRFDSVYRESDLFWKDLEGGISAWILKYTEDVIDNVIEANRITAPPSRAGYAVLQGVVENVQLLRKNRKELLELIEQEDVPTDLFAYAIANARYTDVNSRIETRRTQTNAQTPRRTLETTLAEMAELAIDHAKLIHQDGIDTVIIADRGATPYGVILRAAFNELNLPHTSAVFQVQRHGQTRREIRVGKRHRRRCI